MTQNASQKSSGGGDKNMEVRGTKFKIVATRCHILKLKCTKFDFGWGSVPDRGVNEPEHTGTAFRLEFVRPERRSCSSVTVFENAVPPAEQKISISISIYLATAITNDSKTNNRQNC